MSLAAGTQLGAYKIAGLIGAGGMGEVYQARDSKLGRDVAIKVLPERFASDSDQLRRFQREAKLLASLNHPNIAMIHGLEQSGETHYLVMELVPGETLRERIARDGALPVEEALRIAKQIAEALEAAHGSEKGIIHRDLKPANVKVTPDGRVKVLDFGLAKAFSAEQSAEDVGNSPTLSALPTMQGVIMGTAAYMSPEQARGKAVTKAADIWALGAVLYELLTGRQIFQGQDTMEILASVVTKELTFDDLPANTPAAIRTLLRRCLRKDPRQRLQDATGIRIEIEDVLTTPGTEQVSAQAAKRWGLSLWVAGSAVLVLSILGTWILKPGPVPSVLPVSRFTITLPPGDQLAGLNQPAVALSPDGRYLAYVATRKNALQHIYLRAMDSQEATQVPGTEGAVNPFFSPDGQWLGFFAGGKLKKVSVSGGTAVTLADALDPRGASWRSQGTIIFLPINSGAMQQVSDAGGVPQSLAARFEAGEDSYRWPELLPGGNAVLFVAGQQANSWTNAQVAIQSLATGERRNLIQGGTQPITRIPDTWYTFEGTA